MLDSFVALLPKCERSLRAAEPLAAYTLQTEIVAYFEDKTAGNPDLKASSHSDAEGLIRHFEAYAQSVFDAFAEECTRSKRDFNEYVKMLHCAIGFADEMVPKKLISPDDYYDYSRNPQLWSQFSPSGYWEITFLDCWNKLQDRGVLPPMSSDVGDRFDRVFRCALRLEHDARKFRHRLELHLEKRIKYWEGKWRQSSAKQGTEKTLQPHQADPKSTQQTDSQRGPLQLELTGKTMGVTSNELRVNGATIRMGNVPFLLLVRLVAARFESKDGWIHKVDLVAKEILSEKYEHLKVSRLRRHFQNIPGVKDPKELIVSSGDGKLKLGVKAENIRFDKKALLNHSDDRIKQVAKLLPDAQKV